MEPSEAALESCRECGALFRCGAQAAGAAAGELACWCRELPPLAPAPAGRPPSAPTTCLCPDCLRRRR